MIVDHCNTTYEKNKIRVASDNNIYLRATPHIMGCEMYKEEEEQDKTPIFTMENEGVARR